MISPRAPQETCPPRSASPGLKRPAGAKLRLLALLVDLMVYLPFMGLWFAAFQCSRLVVVSTAAPAALLWPAYLILCHGLWGQTIGKRAAGIKVVSADGSKCSWGSALRRSLPDTLLGIAWSAGMLSHLLTIPVAFFDVLPYVERFRWVVFEQSAFVPAINAVAVLWVTSEPALIFLGRRGGALHDSLSGTIVITISAPSEGQ